MASMRILVSLLLSATVRGFTVSPQPVVFGTRLRSSTADTEIPETSPLPPHTFAGMVEQGLKERFGSDAERVIESWRLVDREYEHREFVGTGDPDSSLCHQLCQSYLPGLPATPFWDTSNVEWANKLKASYKTIKQEFKSVTVDMDRLVEQGNNIWAGALTEDAASYGEGWSTLVLMDRGRWDPVNVNLFPVTAQAVYDSGVPAVEVFFASMKPHTTIQPHSDFTNFVLTSHLALDIPFSGENKCRLTVGDETRQWINGDVMLFDTSIMHDAVNDSDKTRYILMLRLWHPNLTKVEQEALQFTYDCLESPGLVSSNAGERYMAEETMKALRRFPEIHKGTGRKQGFGGSRAAEGSNKKKQKNKKGGGGFGE